MDRGYGGYGFNQMGGGSGFNQSKDFASIAQTIGTNIQKITSNVSSMRKILGTNQDSQELKQQLHQIQHYTKNLVKDTNSNLKDLNNIPAPGLLTEQRECKVQKERLHEEFATAAKAFQEVQRFELQKEKAEVKSRGPPTSIKPPPSSKDVFGEESFSNQLIELRDNSSSQIQLQDDLDLRMLQQQQETIQELEQNISEVNDIFKELSVMVHDQGELVDSIEASVEKTEVLVGRGNTELRQAVQYTNKLRKKRCFLLTGISVVLVVLLLIIFYSN